MSSSAPAVSFIYVNFNLTAEIVRSVETLVHNVTGIPYEIIIVNNGSTEPEAEGILSLLPERVRECILTVTLEANKGFGAGNNAGFSKASGEYIFLINPDTRLTATTVQVLIETASEYGKAAVFAPCLRNENGVKERSFGNFPSVFSEMAAVIFADTLLKVKQKSVPGKNFVQVDWVTGAAMFMQRKVFLDSGGFDENIFLYNEEVDLCKRLADLSVPVFYVPFAEMIHLKSVGSKKDYYRFTLNSYTSKIYYIKKHFTGTGLLFCKVFLLKHFLLLFVFWFLMIPLKGDKAKGKCAAVPQLIGTLFA